MSRLSDTSGSVQDPPKSFFSRAHRRLSALLAGALLLASAIPAGGTSFVEPAQPAALSVAAGAAPAGSSASEDSGFLFKGKERANQPAGSAQPATLPGFVDSVVMSGLTYPSAMRFSPDGRVFIAEKGGVIKVFPSLGATNFTVFADLSTQVYNYWDRGLLGLALHPNFPTTPYVYPLYSYDANIGGMAPKYGTPGNPWDDCTTPPGPTDDGCVTSSRLSRLTAAGNVMTGTEQVLINDWCMQFPSHSIGHVQFGPDGMLYLSGGDGAGFHITDYGQSGTPLNPCGDPPTGVGGVQTPPNAEGGALRTQGAGTGRNPISLDGSILRVNPLTGAAAAGNPFSSSSDPNKKRVVAYGLRNPFRFTFRPGTSEIWIGDVGWNTYEEINRVVSPTQTSVSNFGWPCYEGDGQQDGYKSLNLNACNNLYNAGTAVAPYFTYQHGQPVVPNETCVVGASSSPTGIAFYQSGTFPTAYNNGLFFADYSRNCVYFMPAGAGGLPNVAARTVFIKDAPSPIDLQIGPDGNLYYIDLNAGDIHKVEYFPSNTPPVSAPQADVTYGPLPLTVHFDGSASYDPDAGDTITYSWDLDGNGTYVDSTAIKPTYVYTTQGVVHAGLRVTDNHGISTTKLIDIVAGNHPPTIVSMSPAPDLTWQVGDQITYSAVVTDYEQGVLPASAMTWTVTMEHCPSDCHTHVLSVYGGTSSGSIIAPDHDYPSHLRFKLDATDNAGLTSSLIRDVYPKTSTIDIRGVPNGVSVGFKDFSATTPFTQTIIKNGAASLSAISPQAFGTYSYSFQQWSDGGGAAHIVTAPANTTLTATYSVNPALPTGKFAIYGDALAGTFGDWSWGQTNDLNNTTPVLTGTKSVKITPAGAWGALRFNSDSPVDTTPYDQLQFSLRLGAAGATFQFYVLDNDNLITSNVLQLANFGGNPPAGAWKTYQIPLSALNATKRLIKGFVLQETSGQQQPAYYLDEVAFVSSAGGGTPTPSPTSTPTKTATPTSTQTSTAFYLYHDDLLPDFGNWSWGGQADLANGAPVLSGTKSIKFTPAGSWGALRLNSDTAYSMAPYDSVVFAVHGGTGAPSIQVFLYDQANNPTSAEPVFLTAWGGDPPAGAWKNYKIPLTAFNASGAQIKGISLQERSGTTQPAYYFDEIGFSTPGAAPANTATPTSTSTATRTATAVPATATTAPATATTVPATATPTRTATPVGASTPTATPTPLVSVKRIVYADALQNGFTNQSFRAGIALSNKTHVYAGVNAIRVTPNGITNEMKFGTSSTFSGSSYAAVQVSLWMTASQSSFKVFLYDSSGAATNGGYAIPANLPKGSWQTLTIPMTDLGGTGKTIKSIGIRDVSTQVGPQYWVDNLAFLQNLNTAAGVGDDGAVDPSEIPPDSSSDTETPSGIPWPPEIYIPAAPNSGNAP